MSKVTSKGREEEKKEVSQPLSLEPLKGCPGSQCPTHKASTVSMGRGGTAQIVEWGQDRGWPGKSRLSRQLSPVSPAAV